VAKAPKTTLWKLDPHSRAKHAILARYLHAWTPILTRGGDKTIAYIDGFAGPGRYEGGEDGSPIIALKAALRHRAHIPGKVLFLFVEEQQERADHLQRLVDVLQLPPNVAVKVEGGKRFAPAFEDFRRTHLQNSGRLPPTFAFIDPFGWTRAPFSIVQDILGQPKCEVLVTFMYEEINRFISHSGQTGNFDTFFGTEDWRGGIGLDGPSARNRFLHDLYLRQLKEVARAKYVRSFQMRNKAGVTDYYLFYATGSLTGLKKMKEAMWAVDPSGEFTFSDATDRKQLVLFADAPRYEDLRRLIVKRFAGRVATVAQIEEFVLAETAFCHTHYKKQVLKLLERSDPPGVVVLNAPPGRGRGTFGSPDLRLRFL
jgi:three-Cys-motif partner protein